MESLREELNSMRKNKKNVWGLVILPNNRMPIGSKWIYYKEIYCNMLSGTKILSLLVNALHKGNIYILCGNSFSYWRFWKLWNLEEVGIKTRFAKWIDQFMLLEQASHQWYYRPYMVLFMTEDDHIKKLVWIILCCYYMC